MKNGINQSGRKLKALDPTFVVPDERSLLDLVKFTLSYAEAVAYHNFENKAIGNWKHFLLHDPVFIVGLMASTSLDSFKLKQEDLEVKGGADFESNPEIRAEMAVNLLQMVKNLFHWDELFQDCHYTGPVVKEIRNGIRFLEPILLGVIPAQDHFSKSDFLSMGSAEMRAGEQVSLKESFKLSYKNMVYITEFAAKRFDELVEAKTGDHQPHLGLILAGLKLFKEVQHDLNTLTEKHLDFYYQRILQQQPKQPLSIQVLAGLIRKGGSTLLPEQSSFSLQFPSKKRILLQNPQLTVLSKGKISELRTFYKSDYYPFSTGEKIGELSLNGIFDQILYQGEGKQEISFKGVKSPDFPVVLGEDQSHKGVSQRTMNTSLLGFAVSSPVFLVEKGTHFFKIAIELTQATCIRFKRVLEELLYSKEDYMGISHVHQDHELKTFIHSFLNEAFRVSLSTKNGWKTLDFLHVEFSERENMLTFKIEPEGEEELPYPFSADLHGELLNTPWPCVRFFLNHTAHFPPYKALSLLEIVSVEILSLSKGVRSNLECYNQLGKLDPNHPFLPFGSLPTKDAYLKIFNPLILNKFLSRLALQFTWSGLPEQRNGFIDHYQAYPEEINNQSFRGKVGIKSEAYRETSEEEKSNQEITFFDTLEKSDGEYLVNKQTISVELDLVDKTILKTPHISSGSSEDMPFFFLGIAAPLPFVFGHDSYTEVFADVSFYNSRFPKKAKELPKAAYTPVIEKIEINYNNFTKENFGRKNEHEQESIHFFHLFPFGYSQVFPAAQASESFLLPRLTGKGSLLIGLDEVEENELLNLGFKLHPAYFIHTITQAPPIRWEYLEKNQWHPLGNRILEDSTHGMLQSGIVKLKLPSKLDRSNTRLSAGKFWLRVCNLGTADINSRLMSIFTNAVLLVEKKGGEDILMTVEEIRQPPMLISEQNPMLEGVLGPFHLKIPALKKSLAEDRVRVSEQIRHRKRGVTTWDLERLVLERFPQIGRVMVYGGSDFPLHLVKKSNIQVVVIPQTPLLTQGREEGFRAPFELLQEIKSYLKSFISPFAVLEVSNPVFEKLKVRAFIQFKFSQQAGYYRDKLESELIEFLSPNPGDFQKDKGFIRSIYKAEIQNFMESRPYVASITGFSVLQLVEVLGSFKIIDTADSTYKVERLRTISPYAILTSAESHHLEIVDSQELRDPELSSIGDLSIDSDFIIHSSTLDKS
ncbi:hypothetical protein [Algoriphagus sp.]|uniref:hypothetical protein n=1 Tax=Algoriphagus sp. TaxID=1872435 RepID=UPI00261F6DED|nr:hypothetical protein [Algoriphagus sp.]